MENFHWRVGQALITLLPSFSLPSDIRFFSSRRAATAFAFARRGRTVGMCHPIVFEFAGAFSGLIQFRLLLILSLI